MLDPLSSLPGYLLRRASAASLAELNQGLSQVGLNHADASLLLLMGANPGMTQSDVGRVLGIQRANMVPLIGRNEGRGWIYRKQVDGRSQGLFLSPAGDRALQRTRAIVEEYEAQLLARVPPDLRPHVLPILHHLWGGR